MTGTRSQFDDAQEGHLEPSPTTRSRGMPPSLASPTVRDLLLIGAVVVVYFAGAKAGLHLAFTNRNVTAVWPPTGVALAALILFGPRVWPGIALGALAANLANGASLETSLLISVGNTLAPLTAWVLVQRVFNFRPNLERVPDVCGILLLGGPVSMAVSATLGSTALAITGSLHGSGYGYTWLTWWVGDTMGVVIVCPIILVIGARSWRSNRFDGRHGIEALAVLACLVACSLLVFSDTKPITIVVLPLAAWAAFRFFQLGAAAAATVVAAVSIPATVHGLGPFAHGLSTTASLMTLQVFNGIFVLTAFMLAAASLQNFRAQAVLRRDAAELQGLLDEERQAAFEDMTSVVLHELKNPLAAIMNNHYLLRISLGDDIDDKTRRYLDLAEREAARAAKLTEELREVRRPKKPALAEVDLHQLIEQVVETTPAPPGITLRVVCSSIRLRVDPDQMSRVISNLITNAYEAMRGSGSLELTGAMVDEETVMVSARDSGPGVDEDVIDKVFDPFFSTKAAGTGLGLAIVRKVVEAHGGSVRMENAPAGGACVSVLLPREGPPSLRQRMRRSSTG